ncbi:chemokine XC receptor 1-like [Ambystoma mexicanum]|uniref:chemokine XC receptor 1-like n=1 Tax=Ambystoma mexicanum TaxID=8296 RepID=UPI0037E953BA
MNGPTEDSLLRASTFYDYDNLSDYGPLVFLCLEEDVIRFGEVLVPFFYLLVFCLSLIGNALVLYILLKHGENKNITTIFMCNLAISDLVFATSLPFWAIQHFSMWIFGDAMCKVVSSTFFIGFYSSVMFLTAMAVDRYVAVVHAHVTNAPRNTHCAVATSVVIWSISLLLTIPEFLFSETKAGEGTDVTCEYIGHQGKHGYVWRGLQYFQQTVLLFLVPFGIILFCYLSIAKTLIRCRTHLKHRAMKMIFSIILAFFLCWTPLNVTIFLKAFQEYGVLALSTCKAQTILDYSVYISRNLAYFHCCLNPVLYAFLGTTVRKHLQCPCFRQQWAQGATFRPRLFSNSSAHSTKGSSEGNSRAHMSVIRNEH